MTFNRHAAAILALLPSAFAALPALAAGECLIDDPTGTPLNVRSAPNGAVLTTLRNGTRVEVVDEMKTGTKRWLFVSREGERLGWVFGAYVVCKQAGGTRDAAPGQPADRR
ncbi:SH3 domain-containing protein [Shinella sp. BYT-45]|uniref:SH3 domain-containing protein n=1 Tax=Shinella sp. BYT-45 TaxID=3377377 RepID=UPI003981185E